MATSSIRANSIVAVCLCMVLASCGGVKMWPFDGDQSQAKGVTPSNATLYQCEGGKHFYVRYLDSGNIAWVIYPDREVGLAKGTASGGTTRYSNGVAQLEVSGNEARLNDGPSLVFAGCKAAK